MPTNPIKVTFVCAGNICRSPMAEGVFRHLVAQAGLQDAFQIDSCGTGNWHVGETPHSGTARVLSEHGIDYEHRARAISPTDLDADYLLALDRANLAHLQRMGRTDAEVHLLLDFASGTDEVGVPDPYYTGDFEYVYQLVEAGCTGLLKHIRMKEGL